MGDPLAAGRRIIPTLRICTAQFRLLFDDLSVNEFV